MGIKAGAKGPSREAWVDINIKTRTSTKRSDWWEDQWVKPAEFQLAVNPRWTKFEVAGAIQEVQRKVLAPLTKDR